MLEPVKPVTTLHAELAWRPRAGVHHLLGGPLAHPFGVAVTPDVGGQDGLVALVDQVADGLPDQVVADGVDSPGRAARAGRALSAA